MNPVEKKVVAVVKVVVKGVGVLVVSTVMLSVVGWNRSDGAVLLLAVVIWMVLGYWRKRTVEMEEARRRRRQETLLSLREHCYQGRKDVIRAWMAQQEQILREGGTVQVPMESMGTWEKNKVPWQSAMQKGGAGTGHVGAVLWWTDV